MGDKERAMEAAQGKEKEMQMVLQCPPIYPLPEEIKQMEHSETICRYCGVSYLIYHEFQQLHTRLAQLETELHEVRETAQREKAQREALEQGRMEWERALHLEVQRKAKEAESSMRKELEEKNRDMERVLRKEFEEKNEWNRREAKEEYQKIIEEKEKHLRRELGDLEVERLRRQREELERKAEEREERESNALQKANKNLDELRKYLQQLEERLEEAVSMKREAEQLLGKENHQGGILRSMCLRQHKALQATLFVLSSTGSELTDVRGLLSHLTGAWHTFKSQILQHSTQVSTVLREELKYYSGEIQKTREEKEQLTQQLMEQTKLREEGVSQQEDAEREHTAKLLRLKEELEEKHERWLSCQQRCDTIQEQLSSWQWREEQTNRKCREAEEEMTRLREDLEEVQEETKELRRERSPEGISKPNSSQWRAHKSNRELLYARRSRDKEEEYFLSVSFQTSHKRDILIESHGRALTKVEKNYRQKMASKLAASLEEQRTQSALHLKEQMEAFHREAELELTIVREKNQQLLLQYQRDSAQLQQKLMEREQELRGLTKELQQEKRNREDERRTQDEQRRSREEEMHQELQQEALQLSQAKAELQLMTERNAGLQGEVALLQETVRRECEEREELTAVLSKAQEELIGLRSSVSHQGSSRSPPKPMERVNPLGNKQFHLRSRTRVPLTRYSTSPNTLRHSSAYTDKDRGWGTDGEGAGRSFESQKGGGIFGEEKQRVGTLPKLKASSTVSKVQRKII